LKLTPFTVALLGPGTLKAYLNSCVRGTFLLACLHGNSAGYRCENRNPIRRLSKVRQGARVLSRYESGIRSHQGRIRAGAKAEPARKGKLAVCQSHSCQARGISLDTRLKAALNPGTAPPDSAGVFAFVSFNN